MGAAANPTDKEEIINIENKKGQENNTNSGNIENVTNLNDKVKSYKL